MIRTPSTFLRLFASLLLLAAMLTGVFQQTVLLKRTGDVVVLRLGMQAAAEPRATVIKRALADRSCPPLLHLDATLAAPAPVVGQSGRADQPIGTSTSCGDSPIQMVATPPPRATA